MTSAKQQRTSEVAELQFNEAEFRQLCLFLEEHRKFALAIALYNVPYLRQAVIDRATSVLAHRNVIVTQLDLMDSPNERFLLERLESHYREFEPLEGRRQAVMVTGIESTLDYGKFFRSEGESFPEGVEILANANLQRDVFPERIPVPMVLWLSPVAEAAFARAAPDLWHWRSAFFDFSVTAFLDTDFERQQLDMPIVECNALDRRAKNERLAVFNDALTREQMSPNAPTRASKKRQVGLLNELGLTYAILGDAPRAIECHKQSLAIARETGDRLGEIRALGNLGNAYYIVGDIRRGIEVFEQSLIMARDIGDRRSESNALGSLGNAYAALGEIRRAIEFYEQSLAIACDIGDRRSEGNALGNLGNAYAALGEIRRAIEFYVQSLAIAHETGDRMSAGNVLGNLGNAYRAVGDTRRAIESYEQSLAIARETGDRRVEGSVLGNLGNAYRSYGESRKALDFYEAALETVRENGDRRNAAILSWNLGDEYRILGDLERGMPLMQQCVDYLREIGHSEAAERAATVRKIRQEMERSGDAGTGGTDVEGGPRE